MGFSISQEDRQRWVDRLVRRRRELQGEIARMPMAKQGTEWHLDRVELLRRIRVHLEVLGAE